MVPSLGYKQGRWLPPRPLRRCAGAGSGALRTARHCVRALPTSNGRAQPCTAVKHRSTPSLPLLRYASLHLLTICPAFCPWCRAAISLQNAAPPQVIYRKDYTPTPYLIDTVRLPAAAPPCGRSERNGLDEGGARRSASTGCSQSGGNPPVDARTVATNWLHRVYTDMHARVDAAGPQHAGAIARGRPSASGRARDAARCQHAGAPPRGSRQHAGAIESSTSSQCGRTSALNAASTQARASAARGRKRARRGRARACRAQVGGAPSPCTARHLCGCAQVDLSFDLNEDVTTVTSRMAMTPNYKASDAPPPLVLNGRKDVKLVSIKAAGGREGQRTRFSIPKSKMAQRVEGSRERRQRLPHARPSARSLIAYTSLNPGRWWRALQLGQRRSSAATLRSATW